MGTIVCLYLCYTHIGQDKQFFLILKSSIFPYSLVLTHAFGAQKNRPTETVLLSTNSICFGCDKRKLHVLFVWFDSLRPINNLSVTCLKGRFFLG